MSRKVEVKPGYVKGVDVEMPVMCTCMSFRYPHQLAAHKKLRSMTDWRTWQQIEKEREGNK